MLSIPSPLLVSGPGRRGGAVAQSRAFSESVRQARLSAPPACRGGAGMPSKAMIHQRDGDDAGRRASGRSGAFSWQVLGSVDKWAGMPVVERWVAAGAQTVQTDRPSGSDVEHIDRRRHDDLSPAQQARRARVTDLPPPGSPGLQHNSMVWRSNPDCSALGPTRISTSPASNKGCRSGPSKRSSAAGSSSVTEPASPGINRSFA